MPRRFLRDPQVAVQFHAGHTLEARNQQVDGNGPFLVAQVGRLHYCAAADAEALGALLLPATVGHGLVFGTRLHILRSAIGAVRSMRPAQRHEPRLRSPVVGEQAHHLEEGDSLSVIFAWRFLGHVGSLTRFERALPGSLTARLSILIIILKWSLPPSQERYACIIRIYESARRIIMNDEKSAATEAGQPESTDGQKRERGVSVPQLHLQGCIEIVEAIHALGGNACEWDQIAAKMVQAPKGGGFRVKMLAARAFGLLTYKGQDVTLTSIGMAALDPRTQKKGRVDAFLTVPLFRNLCEELGSAPLPPVAAIERKMVRMGVTPKQAGRGRQRFLRSARDAGFFEIASDRLAKPSIPIQQEQDVEIPADGDGNPKSRNGGGEPPDQSDIHPVMKALLAEMPPPGETWETARCVTWLQMVVLSLGLIYENHDELRKIEITKS